MKIAAFDPSLRETGYARANGDQRETGVIATKPLCGMERLRFIRDRVLGIAARADVVVLEGYAYAAAQGAHQIGELGGVLRLALWEVGLPVVELQPATLKRYLTGKGNAPKDAMLAGAIRRLDYQGSNNNEADALALLHAGLDAYGLGWVKMPAAQRKALEKVEWPEIGTRTLGVA